MSCVSAPFAAAYPAASATAATAAAASAAAALASGRGAFLRSYDATLRRPYFFDLSTRTSSWSSPVPGSLVIDAGEQRRYSFDEPASPLEGVAAAVAQGAGGIDTLRRALARVALPCTPDGLSVGPLAEALTEEDLHVLSGAAFAEAEAEMGADSDDARAADALGAHPLEAAAVRMQLRALRSLRRQQLRLRRPAEAPVDDAVRDALLHPSTDGFDFVRRGMNRQRRDGKSPTVPSLCASPAPSPSPSPLFPAFCCEGSRPSSSLDALPPPLTLQDEALAAAPELPAADAPSSPAAEPPPPSSLAAEPVADPVAETAPATSAHAEAAPAPRLGPARAAPVRRRAAIDSLVERLQLGRKDRE